jgi:ABC-2 type transport system ATP-binding protein
VAVIGHGRLLAEGTIAEVVGDENGRPGYRLVVDDAEGALRILEGGTHVTSASLADGEPSDGPGGQEIRLVVGPEGPGPVVRDLVAGDVAVLALVPARPSLEDLFLELTEERP